METTFLTTEEAAKRLKVTAYTFRKWLNAGTIEGAIKINRSWRVPAHVLDEIAAGKAIRPKSDERPQNGQETALMGTPVSSVISREEAREKGFGFLKGRVSSDAFLEQKHAQSRLELERDERRQTARREVAA